MQMLIVFICWLTAAVPVFGQSVIWINEPFTTESKNLSFGRDSVCFSPNSTILGLVYDKDMKGANPVVDITLKNTVGDVASATFRLKSFTPNQLNWHPLIQKAYSEILQSKHWYYFDITSFPSVINAKNGVDFLTVLYNEAVQSEDQQVPAQLYYKLAQSDQFRICRIDFRKEAGYFNYLWERLQFYGILLKKQQEAQDKTEELIEACRKYGVQQIEQWAQQTAQLSQKVKSYDLTVFKEVERLKIMTETVSDSVSKELKLRLRSLLLLDLSILNHQEGPQKKQLLQRRTVLLKELRFYPVLNTALWAYDVQLNGVAQEAKDKQINDKMLRDVRQRYAPFEKIYQSILLLRAELATMNKMLERFD